ncbi:substrate-binding periplasmic protein [Aliikangiella maris]|uniref:ABC transporter substrate-binding protein n=2 Tax=Aliikangiella maris TaxID=3162458 RepID=A0ABV3MJJ1_9GAMM
MKFCARILIIFYLLINTVVISAEQSKQLTSLKPTLKMVYYEAFAPFSWRENGNMKGILIDIIDAAVVYKLKIPVSHTGLPWVRAQSLVKNNLADGFITVPTAERRQYTYVNATPVANWEVTLMTRKDHPKIEELKQVGTPLQLKGFRVGTNLGNGWAKENLSQIELIETRTVEQLLQMVVANRIDVIIHGRLEEAYYSQKLGYNNELVILPNSFTIVPFNLCISKSSHYADIIEKFESVIIEMHENGELKEIITKYLPESYLESQ